MEDKKLPLAYRMCPKTIDEYVGQEHILAKDKMLYRLIKADRLSSIILYGPPGCGKTSLAKVIANSTKNKFIKLNAVAAGVQDIKTAVEDAKNLLLNPSGRVVLFIDEIHRFNKLQQDALLPYVEDGTVILIGATTENPYFSVYNALLSRSTIFEFKPVSSSELIKAVRRAFQLSAEAMNVEIIFDDECCQIISQGCGGDVRKD